MKVWRTLETRAPLAVAALIAVPLYFAALMASSLALDRPHVIGKHQGPSTTSTELKVYLAALIVPGIVLLAGIAGLALKRHGVYLAAVAGIVCCLLLPGISNGWLARHERRFPLGMDFLKDSDPSNLSSRGEWEHIAQSTVTSITHWTLGLAIGAIVVGALLEVRRRTGRDAIRTEPPPVELDTGGAPQITG
ncbi:MAG TPA: hypothetical protein VFM96_02510 [Gaiellaceae bacterium]|nr:hypothetical protein [Gaiellaceae bacterium]